MHADGFFIQRIKQWSGAFPQEIVDGRTSVFRMRKDDLELTVFVRCSVSFHDENSLLFYKKPLLGSADFLR